MNDTTLIDEPMDDGATFLDFLDSKTIGCIGASVLGMSLLTKRGPSVWHPSKYTPHIPEAARQAVEFCAEKGCDISRLALHFGLSSPRIPTVLVSFLTKQHMNVNIAAVYEPLTDLESSVLMEAMEKFFPWRADGKMSTWVGQEPTRYWSKLGKLLLCKQQYPSYTPDKTL